MRNFVLTASTGFLLNFIVYIGEREKERTHAHIQTQSKTNEIHLGLGPSVQGHTVPQLVEALCYKLEGRRFDSR
jgi:3-deoxy-D-arabino-heptulosonate 7-phosphate (DAHP) synthase class II